MVGFLTLKIQKSLKILIFEIRTDNAMRIYAYLILSLTSVFTVKAQIDNSQNTLTIDQSNNLDLGKYSLSGDTSDPKNTLNLYNSPKKLNGLEPQKKEFSMNMDNGLLGPEQQLTPKTFQKDKEIKDAYKSDQYLGDFKSGGEFVQLIYRDHESVDGDLVRIFLNDDVIRGSVYLTGSFQGFKINLIKGFNKIDIQALNQGESGPNTAEFQLYDDKGNLITANEWNLTTGVKATLIVVKDH